MKLKDFDQQVVKRLDVLIALMLEPKTKELNIKEKVKLLYNIGMGYNQIASILNKSPNNIAVIINKIKKKNG